MKSSVIFFLSLCCCVVPWCDTRITSSPFGWTKVNTKPHQCRLYTLKNRSNVSVNILDYGATIVGISLPDKNNKFADIVMGFEDISAYVENPFNSHFGGTVGRVVNRIGGASFSIAGHRYNVSANVGNDQLHGGFKGFSMRVWEGHVEGERLTLSYLSADGEEGYPGQVLAHVTYWLSEMNELHVQMLATATKPTPINLANHAYFNLAGHGAGSEELYNHVMTLNADSITVTSENHIPTGELKHVGGTVYDLRSPRKLREVIPLTPDNGDGYNKNFCVNQARPGDMTFVSRVVHPPSGRVMEVYSDQPGVQFYTSNHLPTDNALQGKNGAFYKKHGAFCLETQNYPDAMNQPNFPNSILLPGNIYRHNIIFKFSTRWN